MSIVLEDLIKRYHGVPVVDGVSVEIQDGELFVLLGASGSGKSTILRMIAGLVSLDSGRIVLKGRDVTHLPPQERGCGFVFQNYSIFRHMTVAENIQLGLKIRKVPVAERTRKCDELLELVGLAGLGDRQQDQLSGGQQQRVALARALAYEPTVLLLDEPFGALDVKIRVQLRRTLKELRSRLGVTTILVTHDQEEAFDLADRIGIMEGGDLLEVGSPEELYEHPRTPFTATFLGAGNVLVGRAQEGTVKLGEITVPLPESFPPDEQNVQVLIRPEQVLASTTGPVEDCHPLGEGTIVERVFSGVNRKFRVRLPRLPFTRQVQPVVPFGDDALLVDFSTPADAAPDAEKVWVGFRACHILEETHAQILVVDDPVPPGIALTLAHELTQRLGGRATVLAVAEAADRAEEVRTAARDRARAAGFATAEPKIRFGHLTEQTRIEEAEQVYDFTVVAGAEAAGTNPNRLSRRVVGLLNHLRNPLLIAKGNRATLRKLLVCTAAGEPGKADVSAAGRLARRLGASVTLVHVRPPGAPVNAIALLHLQRAERALQALDVPVTILMRKAATPARGILEEMRNDDYDLVVVGQHQAPSRWLMRPDNVALQVCAAAGRSVLVLKDELE